ncbi:MAG: hypothetical protein LBS36_12645 [Oscillospiraceae bacterium]|jgi:hypothetical protein|nr:hypothetical protein [Oscillospiraceae bacterium]
MKKMWKIFSLVLAVLLLSTGAMPVFATDDITGEKDYAITNPYASIDWDEWTPYKSNLHSHSRYSDGELTVTESVNRYYELGYDVLATTDHGVINRGWNVKPELVPVASYYQYIMPLNPMLADRYEQITTGAGRDGRPMLDVDRGIELNAMVIKKNHVNGFFSDYGQNYLGIENDYETSVAGVDAAGGISFINHPGDFIGSAGNPDAARDMKNVKLYGDLFLKYDSCVGFEVFNGGDSVTRNDRILWDNILQYTIPRGVNVWGFSNDDSHTYDSIGRTAEIIWMPELSNEALRTAMENGTFFACSTRAKNEMGDSFEGTGEYAVITKVLVDDAKNQITVETAEPETVEWIANEKVIHVGNTIDLNAYEDDITCYVRAQIRNEGGVVLTQAFVCDDGTLGDGITQEPEKPLTLWDKLMEFFRVLFNFKIFEAFKKLAK